ncbi:TIGR04282 family arsenosugar biosynthesis glycosyltransferase [Lichenifustis flavocetrariae]|uniref:Glycosyltransferase n=1 Tax=Lichenifustis flavocetrariae TaxID=2949735 RepID=A0AA41Z0J8_9HYPH|nr:glycosyltransferase [Lichenifustis flavocetrariae]MCW6511544.1 glycosyltransferase [Lichenifustis flavocetrariae]
MAKASAPGRTKTRLVPPLTFEEAADFNTAFLRDMAAKMLLAARQCPIAPFMAFGPPGSEPFFRDILPTGVGLIESWLPNFGQCLFRAISALLDLGHGSACVLNADSPTLPVGYLVEAARVLDEPADRMVLGPSTDGGYYLLGVKQAHRRLFEDVDWSTEYVAAQTLDRASEIGLPVHLLPTWYDVDDAASLDLALRDLTAGGDAANMPAGRPSATLALMRRLGGQHLADRLGLVQSEPTFSPSAPALSGARV